MSDAKSTTWDNFKKYGYPILIFLGGVTFERYALPKIEREIFNRTNGKFSDKALKLISDLKKYIKENPKYSGLSEPLDVIEHYFSDQKYREQNK